MKFIVTLLLLSAAVVSFAAVAKAPATRANLSVGSIGPWDRLLHRGYLYRQGLPNSIQYQDYMYRGNATNRISAVRAIEVGATQYATPWIIQGGVGFNFVTIRVQSARGWGYYYNIEIYGRSFPYREPRLNTIQYEDVVYRGNTTTNVTAVQATEIGGSYSSAWVIGGGVGHSNVTVRLQSAPGYGYYYVVDIWGH